MALSWSMDKLGPITRSVEDCAIVFNAIQGSDNKDLSLISAPFYYTSPQGASLKGMRIGFIKSEFNRKYANSVNDSLSLKKLKDMGAELVELELPILPYRDMLIILSAESGAAFEDLTLSNRDDLMVKQDKNAWPSGFRSSHFIPAVEYIQANRARAILIEEIHKKMKGLDAFIAPAFGQNLVATNLSGHPCVVLPNGFRNGMPTSITFTGQLFGEGKLLKIAEAYQRASDFHKKQPSLNF
jgi:Asp-tRNA(Asn)/Glu-tRNA(Gln) amidotransferase A subunit family amidase